MNTLPAELRLILEVGAGFKPAAFGLGYGMHFFQINVIGCRSFPPQVFRLTGNPEHNHPKTLDFNSDCPS